MNFLEGQLQFLSLFFFIINLNTLWSHVEDSDETILDAAVGEFGGETGLILSNIVGEFLPLEYSVEKILAPEEGAAAAVPTTIVKSTIQLNFVAQVVPLGSSNAFEVKLNPDEHQN